jgi:hypothetical protein
MNALGTRAKRFLQSTPVYPLIVPPRCLTCLPQYFPFPCGMYHIMLLLLLTDAFQRAKQRMIAARENLATDFVKTLGAFAVDDGDEETDA